ncbi:unnamed protein product [Parnassius apollo]|uniref:(apollo) hypothetical protein n=1 Tax=Parnassius apollo TaxID=110799 RepID=A0A8S3W6U7_PARAO|nr:unnamed protein product [Parnassius apollo]
MVTCGACGRYLPATDGITCGKYDVAYHRGCLNLSEKTKISTSSMCLDCKNKAPRTGDHSNTSVKCQGVSECSPLHKDIDISLEIRLFRNELSTMRNELKEVRKNISMLKDTVLACNINLEEMDCRVTKLEKLYEERLIKCDTKILEDTISDLRVQLNERDQDLLANDLEISGLPEQKGENPINTVVLCAKKMGLDIDHREIVHAERAGILRTSYYNNNSAQKLMSTGPRKIVVWMSRRAVRDDCGRERSRVRRNITSDSLGLPVDPCRIYINERLTSVNRKLFGKTREAAKMASWCYTWTNGGQIFVKKEDGKPVTCIRSDIDLSRVFC